MSNKLIFMHIPKCGGTTFNNILDKIYLSEETFDIKQKLNTRLNIEDFINLKVQEKDRIKLLKGHMQFGLHSYFSASSEYITFLRNPIERIISYYYYVKKSPWHHFYRLNLFNDEMSLYDFVTEINFPIGNKFQKKSLYYPVIDINNGQTRLISGIQDKEEFMLEKALENIKQYFSFVGTIEKFNESLIILQKMYGWSITNYEIKNKNDASKKIEEIDRKTIDAIKYFNAADIALYETMSFTKESFL
ncbi:MAG: sulfotransferase family 2 domain-containing protein [Flavobacteriales bacterium]